MSKFGKRLKELRDERELNQEQIGKLFHVQKSAVSKWEKGMNSPDIETITRLADYFDVSTDYLLGITDKRKPNHLTKEDMIRSAPEFAWLFEEEGLKYVELIEGIKDDDIPPEALKETIELILKYRHLNKEE